MQTVARILEVEYDLEPELVVKMYAATSDGQHLVAQDTAFLPYFYVIPEEDAFEDVMGRLMDGEIAVEKEDEPIEIAAVDAVERTDGRQTRDVIKVSLSQPPDVPKVKDAVWDWETVAECREFDIPFYKRYLIDHQIDPAGWARLQGELDESGETPVLRLDEPPKPADEHEYDFRVLAFDLEVHEDEIFMASIATAGTDLVLVTGEEYEPDYDAEYVEVVADEKALLERLIAVVDEHDPDIVTGYNTDEFDFQQLRDRAEAHDVTLAMGRTDERMTFQRRGRFAGASLEGRIHLDLYAFVENVVSMGMQSETLTLDAVAEELLGENKEDMSWDEMKHAWENKVELDRLAQYALKDAQLAYRLGDSLIPQIISLSQLTGLPPFDTCRHSYGQLVENFLIKQAYRENRIVPNRPGQDERSRRYHEGAYAGGFVYEPEKGLHENIALFDFRSLYPTIIVAHNISPDVLNVDGCDEELEVHVEETGSRYQFCQDDPGFIPDILEDVVSERYELKKTIPEMDPEDQAYRDADNRQNALKILANAFYGYLGYNSARWYSRPCAEATTYLGRKYIHDTIETAEDMGLEVVYGDTDSVFIKGDDVLEQKDAFQDRVNEMLPTFMELEFEGFYPRGLFTYTKSGQGAKKKYALLGEDGNVKITGFEQVRRDWSPIAKQTQERIIQLVLEDRVEEAVQIAKDTIEDLRSGNVDIEDLKIYTQMKKKPENYKSKTPHTEAAKRAIKRGEEISPGDVIAYVITGGGGPVSDRAELLEYAKDYDATYYIENQVVPVALRVLKVFGYSKEQLLGNGKQTGLSRFS